MGKVRCGGVGGGRGGVGEVGEGELTDERS